MADSINCFFFVVGGLVVRALLFWVYNGAPDVWKLPYGGGTIRRKAPRDLPLPTNAPLTPQGSQGRGLCWKPSWDPICLGVGVQQIFPMVLESGHVVGACSLNHH